MFPNFKEELFNIRLRIIEIESAKQSSTDKYSKSPFNQ